MHMNGQGSDSGEALLTTYRNSSCVVTGSDAILTIPSTRYSKSEKDNENSVSGEERFTASTTLSS